MPSAGVAMVRKILLPIAVLGLFIAAALYQNDLLLRFGISAMEQVVRVFPYVVQCGIWVSGAYLVNRIISVFLWESFFPRTIGVPVPRLIRDVVAVTIYTLGLTGILGVVFGRSVTGILATTGAAGIVIGLALKNVILDVFIGLAINVDRPFAIGDYIHLHQHGLTGRVVEINWRTTRLLTGEGNLVVVPNSRIGDMVVTNWSKPDDRGEFELVFSLDFDIPVDRAIRVLLAGARAVAGVDGILSDPQPVVRVKGTSGLGVDYKVKYWVLCSKMGPGKARSVVARSVLDAIARAGLSLAYPKQDVFHTEMPHRTLDSKSDADRRQLLSRVELFSSLDAAEIGALANRMRERFFREGEALIRQGVSGDSMFILFEGLLDVNIAFADGDGKPVRVGRIQSGQFFGEMSMLTGEPRSATITAATDVLAFEITADDMRDRFAARPELMEIVSRAVAERKLRNTAAHDAASPADRAAEQASLTQQIVDKIKSFFGVKRNSAPIG